MKTWHLILAFIVVLWILTRSRKTIAGRPVENADEHPNFFKPFNVLAEPWVEEDTSDAPDDLQAQPTIPAGSDPIFFVPNPFNPFGPPIPVGTLDPDAFE